MTCLVIIDLTPTDKTQLSAYSAQAADTVTAYGGKFIAKGEIEILHGDSEYKNKAVIEFPNQESARNWYHSEAYQALVPLREKGMNSQFHLV
ncbi:DUF1330 domain-containing protein [Vibrio sp. RC27]